MMTWGHRMDLGQNQAVKRLEAGLKENAHPVIHVQGTWGSFAPLLVAHLWRTSRRPFLYIRPHIEDAHNAVDDLLTFGASAVDMLPAWEGEEDYADATDEIRSARLSLTVKLLSTQDRSVIAAPIQALCQPVPRPDAIESGTLSLSVNQDISPDLVAQWLVDNGFESVDRVDVPGQFARRGGILDVFAPVTTEPVGTEQGGVPLRLEFFGDTIESLRQINLDTHRSTAPMERIHILSATAGTHTDHMGQFIHILPAETLVVMEEPADCQDVARVLYDRVDNPDRLYPWQDIHAALSDFQQLHISRFGVSVTDPIELPVRSIQQIQHNAASPPQGLSTWAGHKAALASLIEQTEQEGRTVRLYCESAAELTRVREIVEEIHGRVPEHLQLLQGLIHQGFALEDLKVLFVSHHELFGQSVLRRRQRPMRAGAPVDSLNDLQVGDYVVHASYGIGKFLGIEVMEENHSKSEYLTIEYADKEKIHVSVNSITLIQKYIGTSPKRPKLSKVGSKKWQKQKDKVARSIRDLAAELLQVQAARESGGGITFGSDSHWQCEFEASFPYQETADQITAIEQIKADMERPVTMDRLLCGDVGYGKTEVAMRAAFKAVENGKQVAILVPTTVLCVQHGRTFTERFADFPVTIEVLNRFKTPKQAAVITEQARQGKVDILIGTHRLLSGDVGFKDLGLLIIDEEQRFGVEHKERLKRMRLDVDILTMTATPIPRTLHMSLLGLRDISSLSTPPLDRRSVVTRVARVDNQLIRRAVLQELNRGGQIFFLHNYVKTIEKRAWDLMKLIKDTNARVRIAHGRMAKSELEDAMISFVEGHTDILVCTTIIESGLDIPNANTLIVDNADRFGLAELHQLRGRVGRYRHRAYAYLLLPQQRSVNPVAAKRLKAIEEYSHLGAGFRIALRDLEIRGAGNILGAEQSGHIQIVGYQMYCDMLAQAVRKLKQEPSDAITQVTLDLGFATYIPRDYIQSDRQRMEVYRRIAACTSEDILQSLTEELADVYGDIPPEVEQLLDMARIRIQAAGFGIRAIIASRNKNLAFTFTGDTDAHDDKIRALFAGIKGKIRIPDPRTVIVQLEPNYFEPATLMTVLRKLFAHQPAVTS